MSRIFLKSLFVIFLIFVPALFAQQAASDPPNPVSLTEFKDDAMMRNHLRNRVHAALDTRLEKLEGLQTGEQIASYQGRLRSFFEESVDLDSFARSPLKAKTTGCLERDGYSVEKVIFESLPGFHVTGNLYRPAGDGPFPTILHPCGHTSNGKAADVYQKANLILVKNGFVVFCYDPIGQGERLQLIDPKTGKGLHKATGEHHILGVAPVLLGRGLSSYMIWDGMRAIDYLESRSDVDPKRIGCTGNSGGGNMTSFLMALDDRIVAAAPGCFMTTTRQKNEKPGPGDPEQNIFAQIREGLDHPDFAIIRAPRPTLILSATGDFVPIDGTWLAFRQAKRVYTQLGFPERIDLVEAPEKHGYSIRLREGAVRFFARWLQGRNIEVFEPEEVAVEKEEDLLCSPKGQVIAIEGAKTLFDLNAERAGDLKAEREEIWSGLRLDEKRELVREVTGMRKQVADPVRIQGLQLGTKGLQVDHGVFQSELGIMTPFLLRQLESADDTLEIVLTDRSADPRIKEMGSHSQVYLNLRDSGLTKTKNWRFYGADQWISYMLGTSYLAMRAEDLIAITKFLKAEKGGRSIHLHAESEFVPVAIHAAALEPALFDSLTLDGGITTWDAVIESRDPIPHLHNVIHRALRHYDLSDLLKMIPEEQVTIRQL